MEDLIMAIDKTGLDWKGESFEDLSEYLDIYTSENYECDEIKQVKCECGSLAFTVKHEPDEGYVKVKCDSCGKERYICDCEEIEDDIETKDLICECKGTKFEVGVGFSYRYEGKNKTDIMWITVGARCLKCGILGSPSDWKIDYSPSLDLVNKI
jgi:hypothetical protein